MRKFLVKLASMVLVFAMCLTSLVGCGLVTTDVERDMNQVVATIQIDENAPKEVIYKKDMITSYLNYGYMYESYYGYTKEQTFTLIIESLVNNRIFVQKVILELQEEQNKTSWNVIDYLDDESKLDAEYNSIKAVNDLIDSYKTEQEELKADSSWVTDRVVPTNATNKEEDVDKQAYVNKGILTEDTNEYKKAYNTVIDLLRVNELLDGTVDGVNITYNGDIKNTVYYAQMLKSYRETELVENYENRLKDEIRQEFTFDVLKEEYLSKRQAQQEMSNADFVSKLSSATNADPILVGSKGSYGYVYNLLLGADTVLTDEIANIKVDNPNVTKDEYVTERNKILSAVTVTDQRSSWIASGYDFDFATKRFTGDYTFAKDTANSLEFKGAVSKYEGLKEDAKVKYRVDSLTEYNLIAGDDNNFIDMMEEYVYSGATYNVTYDQTNTHSNKSVYRMVTCNQAVSEYENKINELLFAFSTDPGSLNTYKGYVIKPVPEGADKEEYVEEFADAARELIAMENNKFGYVMVATDYGYHVMFYSEILNANYNYPDLVSYLNDLYGVQEWQEKYAEMLNDWDNEQHADNYLYLLAESLSSTKVTNAITKYQRDTLNATRYSEDGGVTLYADRYADLLGTN